MSLDVSLTVPKPGQSAANVSAETMELYSSNITHNLGKMAKEAGIYEHLWRPEEIGIKKAKQLIEPLTAGLALMQSDRARFETFNASNGWGTYKHFIPFIKSYMEACRAYPEADVWVSR
jgi:hypothetical protein